MSDRSVHATVKHNDGDFSEVVRYDRAGKWYYESSGKRRLITLGEAVDLVARPHPRVVWHEGRFGGRAFDAAVRRRRGSGQ